MFKFLFGTKPGVTKPETQRDTFERVVKELNEMISAMPQKPKVTVDPNTGSFAFEAPEQFPDEALALPKPEVAKSEPEAANAKEEPKAA